MNYHKVDACVLYADPRIKSDMELIKAFNKSRLLGIHIPAECKPELHVKDRIIHGPEKIREFISHRG